MLSEAQLATFQHDGHVTVPDVFDADTIAGALQDVQRWGEEFLTSLSPEKRRWYVERSSTDTPTLRKLDEPVFQRKFFRAMASDSKLISIVQQLIGPRCSVFFSQVFCKAPEVGGPKPIHQDNFYFGPDDLDATLTVWIALDDATIENGCLFYADGSHQGPVLRHVAPEDEPFNLQISSDEADGVSMTAAPVPAGGVSFHHGNTWHQSSANRSSNARRAVAMHYLAAHARLASPALAYDPNVVVPIAT